MANTNDWIGVDEVAGARKLVFYGATSLDGYIARENDSLDWLFKAEGDGEDNGYLDFYSMVDTIIWQKNIRPDFDS